MFNHSGVVYKWFTYKDLPQLIFIDKEVYVVYKSVTINYETTGQILT